MADEKYNKWCRWFATIRQEIINLCHHRQIFDGIHSIASNNPKIQIPSAYWDFLSASYAAYCSVAVRRLVKTQKDSISFAGLLKDMLENPAGMNVEHYKRLYAESVVEYRAEADFRRFSDDTGRKLNSDMIGQDLLELENSTKKIEHFADRRVAHIDKRQPNEIPTFNDLNDSINTIEQLGYKYQLILLGASSDSLTPTIQDDWQAIFRVPWIIAS